MVRGLAALPSLGIVRNAIPWSSLDLLSQDLHFKVTPGDSYAHWNSRSRASPAAAPVTLLFQGRTVLFWMEYELLGQRPRTPLEANLRRIRTIKAGTQYMCGLAGSEEVKGEPNRKARERGGEENIYEQFIQGLRNFGDGCGCLGMFFVRDIFHLASPELLCLRNEAITWRYWKIESIVTRCDHSFPEPKVPEIPEGCLLLHFSF